MNGTRDTEKEMAYEIDLRSDTITRPTIAMREAMRNAVVGDDVYGEDPTIMELERRMANLLGKEKSLFMPTGTMSNLVAIMIHCDKRGSEMIAGNKSHIYLFEQGGAAQIANVLLTTIENKSDGTFDLDKFKSLIRLNPDAHEPETVLCTIENTHNVCGGKILPLNWIKNLTSICKECNVAVHMDGARLFNASVALKVDPKKIVEDCDSVSICLSKSLGAPVGSVLCGSAQFIAKARRIRKVLGGGMRQAGILAAAGIICMDQMIDRLAEDHERTYAIAKAIHDAKFSLFPIDLDCVQTNMFVLQLNTEKITAKQIIDRLVKVTETERNEGINVTIKVCSRWENWIRFTLYHEVTDNDVKLIIQKLLFVFKEFEKSCNL